jgi:undecaprenyl-diphosphatase
MLSIMELWQAILLGVVEGVTEFLPISSTGHLTILEKLMGFTINDPSITAFTAIIQVGAVFATLLYFRRDIVRIAAAWLRGLRDSSQRTELDYRFGWAVILGSLPIAVIGLLFKDHIETTLRSLWFVAGALLVWSAVMWLADHTAKQTRHERDVTWKDTLIIGLVQCLALIPGVSRSGAAMSAGLFRGLDRVAVTRLAFFLSIPALTAASVLQTVSHYDEISAGVGWPATIAATITSFVVAYLAVAWLLKFIAGHSYTVFIVYRVVLGGVLLLLLATGTIAAT